MTLEPPTDNVLVFTNSLVVNAGGVLDIGDNAVVVNYVGASPLLGIGGEYCGAGGQGGEEGGEGWEVGRERDRSGEPRIEKLTGFSIEDVEGFFEGLKRLFKRRE